MVSTATIDDLPNELLDEIFGYVYPEVNSEPIIPINTVCRRWNRPFMTHTLWNKRLPKGIDLRTKFPKLTIFRFYPAKYLLDFSFFKGHAFLKELELNYTDLVPLVLNCPRLSSLILEMGPLFFKNDNLEILLTLLPRLENLHIDLYSAKGFDSDLIPIYNQKLLNVFQSRPNCQLKLKSLYIILDCQDLEFMSFCNLFQTPSLDHFKSDYTFRTPEETRKFFECFPNIQSLRIGVRSMESLMDMSFDHITALEFSVNSDIESLSLSSLMSHFPNVVSLEVYRCSIVLDLKYPTRLTHLRMEFTGPIQPHRFCHLNSLDWTIDQSQFNEVMQGLGMHCPRLQKITVNIKKAEYFNIHPDLDGIVFPLLTDLKFSRGDFELNRSLVQFFARHGQQIRD